jgi:hypothetical protein
MRKIKGSLGLVSEVLGLRLSHVAIFFAILLLFYTRFVNLGWGLPYPFHPDERNMADAIVNLKCSLSQISNCLNPHFFAYGQFPLYLSSLFLSINHFFDVSPMPVTFVEAVMALRLLSAVAAVATIYVLYKTVELLQGKTHSVFTVLLFIFSPVLIQFAHFGTTESLLMLFFTLLTYLGLLHVKREITLKHFIIFSGITIGLAIGTKVSAIPFIGIPFFAVALYDWKKWSLNDVRTMILIGIISVAFALISSPFNLIAFDEFRNSMTYETAIGTGALKVFYTQQFFKTIPLIFQSLHIFPYTLGVLVFALFLVSFLLLPRTKEHAFLRFAVLLAIVPSSFLYAKWTRFVAPAFPLMVLMAALYLNHMKIKNIMRAAILLLAIIPGIAYLSVYTSEDVRTTASRWMYMNVPQHAKILTEGGNVVDVPIPDSRYTTFPLQVRSFDFYNYDIPLPQDVEYNVVPSRRVYMNYTCEGLSSIDLKQEERCVELQKNYPLVNSYYRELFNGKRYTKIKEFTSYPKLSLFGRTIIEFPDQEAEETWTVFDHPVIQLYQKNK